MTENEFEIFPRGFLMIDEKGEKSKELVKDLAKKVKVPLFILSVEDFDKISNIKTIFDNIEKMGNKKAIVFVEKFDTLAPVVGPFNTNLERLNKAQAVNNFISEMDKSERGIIFFSTINGLNTLDPTVMRPGRFDRYLNLFPSSISRNYLTMTLNLWNNFSIYSKLSIGIIVFVCYVLIVKMFVGGNPSMNLLQAASKSKHEFVENCNVKFDNVQGCDEIKSQLMQIVDFLKNPSKYEKFNAVMPRGYLLTGPPGVGKTMLAKAVAGEAKVPFLSISGAEFEEMFLGVGAARVRNLFVEARKFKKAVIFIDEIDAVAGKRGAGHETEQSSRRQTLNQLLVEMDGFKTVQNGIIVLAATNSHESLDPAILRPGRFDQTFTINPPDIEGRKKILKRLLSSIPSNKLAEDVNVDYWAHVTIGFTGAELTNFVNRAKLFASIDESATVISKGHFKKAKDFISLGPERDLVMSEEDKERTAYHEAGHAVVALATPDAFPVHQATIVPHSNSLGLVLSSPEKDINHLSLKMLEAKIDMTLAGFLAEEIKYGHKNVSTGAASDLKSVNEIAKIIVNSGFGDRTSFLQPSQNWSEKAKQNFEEDMMEILEESKKRSRAVLLKFEKAWKAIAEALIEHENLNREQLEEIFKKNSPKK